MMIRLLKKEMGAMHIHDLSMVQLKLLVNSQM